jgi:segregation and condensation protein B
MLFGTTREFMTHFGLRSLADLPKPKELEELLAEGERKAQAAAGPDGEGDAEAADGPGHEEASGDAGEADAPREETGPSESHQAEADEQGVPSATEDDAGPAVEDPAADGQSEASA